MMNVFDSKHRCKGDLKFRAARSLLAGVAGVLVCSFSTLADANPSGSNLPSNEIPTDQNKQIDSAANPLIADAEFNGVVAKSAATDDKWYVGEPLAEIDSEKTNPAKDNASVSVTNVAVDDSRHGWKVNVEFDLSEHFAIGAAYVDLNDVELDINSVANNPDQKLFSPGRTILANSADGFTLESIYHYNVNDNIGLTGSVGVFNWQGDFTSQALAPSVSGQQPNAEGGTDVYFGLGGGYQLTEDMTLEINWERYQLKDEATQMWSIGLNYHFK